MKKEFKVIAVSENTNSFGLRGMILVTENGEMWQVTANYLKVHEVGYSVKVDVNKHNVPNWAKQGFETPQKMRNFHPNIGERVFQNS